MSPPSGPPCTPLLIPDIKCALERIPGDKKARIPDFNVLFKQLPLVPCSFF